MSLENSKIIPSRYASSRRFSGWSFRILRAVSLMAALGASLFADDWRKCDRTTIKGRYGYTLTGTRPVPGGSAGQVEQVVGVGVRYYDGEGNFTQVDTSKGAITGAVIDNSAAGTYLVNPNCTGTAIVNIPGVGFHVETRFIVMDNGKEIRWMVLNPLGSMVTGHAVRP